MVMWVWARVYVSTLYLILVFHMSPIYDLFTSENYSLRYLSPCNLLPNLLELQVRDSFDLDSLSDWP